MLQNRRRNRIARLIIGGMSTMPQKEGPDMEMGMDYGKKPMDYDKKPMDYDKEKPKPMMSSYEALEMSCGAMMQAIRSDDVKMLCRAFKAAYKACEQYEEEMEGSHGSHGSHGGGY